MRVPTTWPKPRLPSTVRCDGLRGVISGSAFGSMIPELDLGEILRDAHDAVRMKLHRA